MTKLRNILDFHRISGWIICLILLLFFSLEGWAQWAEKNNGLKGGQVRLLTAAQDTIFVGTLNGLFRSVNRGGSWEKLNPDPSSSKFSVRAIAFRGRYVFCSSGANFNSSSREGFFMSSDYGKSWTEISGRVDNAVVRFIKIDVNSIFLGTDTGIYRSTNSGASWVAVNAGLTSTFIASITFGNSIIFVSSGGKVYKSTNNGTFWVPVDISSSFYVNNVTSTSSALFVTSTTNGVLRSLDLGLTWQTIGLSSNFIKDIVFSGNELFALSSNNIFTSTDNGNNWTVANFNLVDSDFQDGILNCIVANGNKILIGNEFGEVFEKESNSSTWVKLANGFTNVSVKDIAQQGNNIFLATEGDGIFLSQDVGENWTRIKKTLIDFNSIDVKGGVVLAGTPFDGVLRSQDNGQTWRFSNSGLTLIATTQIGISGSRVFISTANGLFVSDDDGLSWQRTKIANGTITLTSSAVISFKTQYGRLLAGTVSDGIFVTDDNGLNWIPLFSPNSPSTVKSMAVNAGKYYAGINRKLYRSVDIGLTWEPINSSLLFDIEIASLATLDTNVFSATYRGVYSSNDNGKNWNSFGLDNIRINIVEVVGNKLFAGTQDKGLFVREILEKKTPIITWSNPADIVYGNPISDTQLNASSNVAGIFQYVPPTGTMLDAGSSRVLTLKFTPLDIAIYNTVERTVVINVLKANQQISFGSISDRTIGDSDFQLSSSTTSNLPVSYTSNSDKVLLGNNQVSLVKPGRATVSAIQNGNSNYNPASPIDRSFCIKPSKPVITVSNNTLESPLLTSNSLFGNQWFLNNMPIQDATSTSFIVKEQGVYSVKVKVDDCTSEFSDSETVLITGDFDTGGNAEFPQVYPNPTRDFVHVSFNNESEEKSISIYSLIGVELMNKSKFRQSEVDFYLGDLGQGVYIVRVESQNRVAFFRIFRK